MGGSYPSESRTTDRNYQPMGVYAHQPKDRLRRSSIRRFYHEFTKRIGYVEVVSRRHTTTTFPAGSSATRRDIRKATEQEGQLLYPPVDLPDNEGRESTRMGKGGSCRPQILPGLQIKSEDPLFEDARSLTSH
ncbi:unnamed protein product [Sphenostylis stenocarpa]|uniref:Uncharacterized protein n=1 Tax=Sphenostylis stenocarpa TaxID=92480 RepID=A0AA86VEF8_9FABA|nr:unnamed protein product [Sphenostylis stenocarpa]